MEDILRKYEDIPESLVEKMKDIYFERFLENPPEILFFGTNHPAYVYLLEKSLTDNKPITDSDLNNIIKKINIKTDLIEED